MHTPLRRPVCPRVSGVSVEPAAVVSSPRPAPPTQEAGRGGREAAQRPSLGKNTHNPSKRRPDGHRKESDSAKDRSARQWFGLRDGQRRKVDRADPRQRQHGRDRARAERFELRGGLRPVTESRRVAACGLPGAREDGSVVLRLTDAVGTPAESTTGAIGRVAGFSGLFTCGNVWMCPECSVRVAAKRAAEVEQVMAHFLTRGGWAVLVTLTMRHHRRHSLRECLTAGGYGWSKVTSGGAWSADRDLSGFAGYVRALEVTESPEHGWHVHFHAVLVFHERPADELIEAMADGMFRRWSSAVQRKGMPAPLRDYGLDVQMLDPATAPAHLAEQSTAWARYITKGLAQEAVLGSAKDARGGNRSIRQLMRDALIPQRWEDPSTGAIVSTVDLTARARLHEYERAIAGRKQLTWSQKKYDIREQAGLRDEQTDEEIAAEQLDGEDVAVIPRESWRRVEPRAADLLAATEWGGADGGRRWLDDLGVQWWRPTKVTEHRRHGEIAGRRHVRDVG